MTLFPLPLSFYLLLMNETPYANAIIFLQISSAQLEHWSLSGLFVQEPGLNISAEYQPRKIIKSMKNYHG